MSCRWQRRAVSRSCAISAPETASQAGRIDRLWSCIFFFQAEDGIRDLTVTGVQTCALPIFLYNRTVARAPHRPRLRRAGSRGASRSAGRWSLIPAAPATEDADELAEAVA